MTSSIAPVFADGKKVSVFQKMENFFNEPFLAMEKAAGGDGHKRPSTYQQPSQLKPFLSSWLCQIFVGDVGKIADATSQDIYNAASICK